MDDIMNHYYVNNTVGISLYDLFGGLHFSEIRVGGSVFRTRVKCQSHSERCRSL